MSGRKGKYDYHRLREERTYTDAQFRKPAVKVPVKAIGLAVMLFLVGSVLLILGSLLATGVVGISVSERDYVKSVCLEEHNGGSVVASNQFWKCNMEAIISESM
ncbi:transmembrane protein 230-like isoform X2 [Corticium candelabrum]|uniref:transmembrane protein 230-like isoform X2 n=1 Tax=Corticium candelabrum TaxID=121492 RepID=UPI002E252D97|nr:transmembrane protein 230-like isoform X2 [Corticium candelabrum]